MIIAHRIADEDYQGPGIEFYCHEMLDHVRETFLETAKLYLPGWPENGICKLEDVKK